MQTGHQLAVAVSEKLQLNGYSAYLVGGCVRDRLLGIEPKDFDISTDATPVEVHRLFPKAELVGAHFGVMVVRDQANAQVEVATFRSEGSYSDGRRPDSVSFETAPGPDAKRRDFTINGLFEDPHTHQILDFVDGKEDLRRKLIRAIGDPRRRFAEDHLRMLRAVRFAARFDFTIQEETLAAIQNLAPQIVRISPERVRDEIVRILTEGQARRGFELLDQTGLLEQILPEVKAFQGVEQPPEYHPEGDVWTHVLMMLDKLVHPTRTLAWGVLLHDVGKPPTLRVADRIRFDGHAEVGADMARKLLGRLKVPNADLEQVESLVANHMRFKDVMNMRVSTLKRFVRLPNFEEHLELHRLDCMASNGYTQAYNFVRDQLSRLSEEELRPPRLLSGRDLISAGYQPGPAFAGALEAVESAQLEGSIHTTDEALTIAKSVLDAMSEETRAK